MNTDKNGDRPISKNSQATRTAPHILHSYGHCKKPLFTCVIASAVRLICLIVVSAVVVGHSAETTPNVNGDIGDPYKEDNAVITSGYNINQLRLAGNDSTSGRLEVSRNNVWGTVCDDSWSIEDAIVACRQLGLLKGSVQAIGNASYGAGSRQIWLDDVTCTGSENNLDECEHQKWGIHNCGHTEDAGVFCIIENPSVQVRIVSTNDQNRGRVEVFHNNVWGTVCDDSWSTEDAAVVCRQLGKPHGKAHAIGKAVFGQGTGPAWLNRVSCTGSENNLGECGHQEWKRDSCNHDYDAGVICTDDDIIFTQIRLVGGQSQNEGRVEVFHGGFWGTVCDNGWGADDAAVVCRELGLLRGGGRVEAFKKAHFGQGSRQIWLDSVGCTGSENNLGDCSHNGWGNYTCQHSGDAGVSCLAVRLYNTDLTKKYEGLVEVFRNGSWGRVCDDNWRIEDARVVCRQLGLPTGHLSAYRSTQLGQGSQQILLDGVSCAGSETELNACGHHRELGKHDCQHQEAVGVTCDEGTTISQIRLVGGRDEYEGTVEVLHNGKWSTICDKNWTKNNAKVTCSQLHRPGKHAQAFGSAYFGTGRGKVLLDNVLCQGHEHTLEECSLSWGNTNCKPTEVAGVYCPFDAAYYLRLANGTDANEGRVELRVNGVLGTVCDNNWSTEDGIVVCRQLGKPYGNVQVFNSAKFGQGSGQIWLGEVSCAGSEDHLGQCLQKGWLNHGCNHGEDAGVKCSNEPTSWRLVNGNNYKGFVEVFHNGVWGTVCNDRWGIPDATVVCRQLGLLKGTVEVYSRLPHSGSRKIWLDEVSCSGSEKHMDECNHGEWGSITCVSGKTAGVICNDGTTGLQSRLVGGQGNTNQGRVEVQYTGIWGTVCDHNWGPKDAKVVCRQLGLPYRHAKHLPSVQFGNATGKIWLNEVSCTGSESNLGECGHSPFESNPCTHAEDVGVICTDDPTPRVRVVGGRHRNEGRVEVFVNSFWGTVCDDFWGQEEAEVVCRQLGLPYQNVRALGDAYFGKGSGYIWFDDVGCLGSENDLGNCQHLGWQQNDCKHSEDAGVICTDEIISSKWRLVGGNGIHKGRVEVYHSDTWGTVCDNGWTTKEATVLCRHLGLPYGNVDAPANAWFGQGSGKIWLDEVSCTGTEYHLGECKHKEWGKHQCQHDEDASVICRDGTVITQWRLVGGSSENEGRVELRYEGDWGTVGHTYWSTEDATVLCRQLGLPYEKAQTRKNGHFGVGTRFPLIDQVVCTGSEDNLSECPHVKYPTMSLQHNAAVVCSGADSFKPDLLKTRICGTRPGSTRIFGGKDASKARWPWAAYTRDINGAFHCGASLISERWAITAAHCDDTHSLVFGDISLSSPSSSHQESNVTQYCYPYYDHLYDVNDICLLKLHTPVTYTNDVRPVCLAVSQQEITTYPTGSCYAIGWGGLNITATSTDRLQEIKTNLLTKKACEEDLEDTISEDFICSSNGAFSGTCNGDYGGALTCKDSNGQWHLVGINNWNFGCGKSGDPDVMTRVSYFTNWILNTIVNNRNT